MRRFIDLRGQETGYLFAWYDTIIEEFECFNGNQAWNSWDDFEIDYLESLTWKDLNEIGRYKGLVQRWALKREEEDARRPQV